MDTSQIVHKIVWFNMAFGEDQLLVAFIICLLLFISLSLILNKSNKSINNTILSKIALL